MARGKPHLEFTALDMAEGWEVPPGYPPGIQQKTLASDLDETNKPAAGRGSCASIPVFSPRSPSCTTTGKRSTWCRAT